jgi:gliding motility-associated-like protein
LKPSISLTVDSNFTSYEWRYEDGTLISSSNDAEIINEGSYSLRVTQLQNGVNCEDTFSFELIRSTLPEIQQVNYGELGSNFIEIIATGDGVFEYSIDNNDYQDSNYFPDVEGGTYVVYVRDKNGCGIASREVTIIDYKKFFTPNNDGFNDLWHIEGIMNYPEARISIFDRYGKLLKSLSSSDSGWDGTYNGKPMPSADYWFQADLAEGISFSGHFSMKR